MASSYEKPKASRLASSYAVRQSLKISTIYAKFCKMLVMVLKATLNCGKLSRSAEPKPFFAEVKELSKDSKALTCYPADYHNLKGTT